MVRAQVSALTPERCEVDLGLSNEAGETCALGRGWMLKRAPSVPFAVPPRVALPDSRWPPERASFERQPILGAVESRWDVERADAYLELMQDSNAVYRAGDGVAHPAWLLRLANLAVDRNVNVNPWIHVSSTVQNLRRASGSEPVETRLRVRDLFEKNGHHYADFDVVILDADEAPLLFGEHRAIYRPRQMDELRGSAPRETTGSPA